MKHSAVGQFLTNRRHQLVRAHLGLPPIAGRMTRGLRREEVAYLAGVSVTWYTWLEQGRDVTPPGKSSIRSLGPCGCRTRNTSTSCAGRVQRASSRRRPDPGTAPAHVQRLLDAFADYPALAIAPDWAILAWNAAYAGCTRTWQQSPRPTATSYGSFSPTRTCAR